MNSLWKIAHKWSNNRGLRKYLSRTIELMLFIVNSNSVSVKASIGTNTIFHHHGVGCVVHDNAVIGENCHIFQNVTLGSKWSHGKLDGGAPIIGNNVLIGAGACNTWKYKSGRQCKYWSKCRCYYRYSRQ